MEAKFKITGTETLSDDKYKLTKYFFNYLRSDGEWQRQTREVYDRGDGAAVLMINSSRKTVVLTRQFRLPTFLNGNESGVMTEVCAGVIEPGEDATQGMIREIEEETGYQVEKIDKIFELYMSPASVTEKIHFYLAFYDSSMKKKEGGGEAPEQEDIEVIEWTFGQARQMLVNLSIYDAKTMLLLQYAQLNGLLD